MDISESEQVEARESGHAPPSAGGVIDDRIVEIMVYLHEVLPE